METERFMPVEVSPKETGRASAYELWMRAPNPMVTFFKTLDVTNLVRLCRKRNLKFNMLMDYSIGKATSDIKEFYTLPVVFFGRKDQSSRSIRPPFTGKMITFHGKIDHLSRRSDHPQSFFI